MVGGSAAGSHSGALADRGPAEGEPCFLDTSALYATFDRSQTRNAEAAAAWDRLVRSEAVLFTTNYVLLELTALLQRRLGFDAVGALQDFVLPWVEIAWVDAALHEGAVTLVRGARRRDSSVVDAVSFSVMRARRTRYAFTLDVHFAEQGFICLPG